MPTRRRPVQINPNKTKPGQIKPSKIAWFNLVLFVRIGTFQWVTANPNKKSLPLSGPTVNRLKPAPSDSGLPSDAGLGADSVPPMYCVARSFRFSKQLFNFSVCLAERRVRRTPQDARRGASRPFPMAPSLQRFRGSRAARTGMFRLLRKLAKLVE